MKMDGAEEWKLLPRRRPSILVYSFLGPFAPERRRAIMIWCGGEDNGEPGAQQLSVARRLPWVRTARMAGFFYAQWFALREDLQAPTQHPKIQNKATLLHFQNTLFPCRLHKVTGQRTQSVDLTTLSSSHVSLLPLNIITSSLLPLQAI